MHRRTAVLLGTFVLWACGSKAPEAASSDGDGGASRTADGGEAASNGPDAGADTTTGATGDASGTGADAGDATSDAMAVAASPGWNLVAMNTARRTYLDYVDVPASGVWTPQGDHFPALATWENQTSYSALRFQPYTPGGALTPAQIMALLPAARRAAVSISITDSPYGAAPAPADATSAIQKALDDAAAMASPGAPVDVLVPAGTFDYSATLRVGADVRLRRSPEDTGGILQATKPSSGAIHLAGDRSGALFLMLSFGATARDTTPQASGIWAATTAAPSCTTCSSWATTWRSRPARMSSASPRREGSGPSTTRTTATPTRSITRKDRGIARSSATARRRGEPRRRSVRVRQLSERRRRRARLRVHRELGPGRPRAWALGRRRRVHLARAQRHRPDPVGRRVPRAGELVHDVRRVRRHVSANTVAHANLAGSHDGLLAYRMRPETVTDGDVRKRVEPGPPHPRPRQHVRQHRGGTRKRVRDRDPEQRRYRRGDGQRPHRQPAAQLVVQGRISR